MCMQQVNESHHFNTRKLLCPIVTSHILEVVVKLLQTFMQLVHGLDPMMPQIVH